MTISGRQIVAALLRRGWVVIRVRGSHHIMRSPTGVLVVVPVHGNRDLTKALLQTLLRETGLRKEDV